MYVYCDDGFRGELNGLRIHDARGLEKSHQQVVMFWEAKMTLLTFVFDTLGGFQESVEVIYERRDCVSSASADELPWGHMSKLRQVDRAADWATVEMAV